MRRALVAFGANLGEPAKAFAKGEQFLKAAPGIAKPRASALYQTAPVGGPDATLAYLNGAFAFETSLAPAELFRLLKKGQEEAGGKPRAPWEPRAIDLDLVWMEDVVLESPDLLVPHPRMHYRWFVLKPATDLIPEGVHPLLGWSMAELLALTEKSDRRLEIWGKSDNLLQMIEDRLANSLMGEWRLHCHVPSSAITFHGLGGRAIGTNGGDTSEEGWLWVLEGAQAVQATRTRRARPTVDARGLAKEKVLELLDFFVRSMQPGSRV